MSCWAPLSSAPMSSIATVADEPWLGMVLAAVEPPPGRATAPVRLHLATTHCLASTSFATVQAQASIILGPYSPHPRHSLAQSVSLHKMFVLYTHDNAFY